MPPPTFAPNLINTPIFLAWTTLKKKKPNLQITDMDERDESEVNGIDQIINKITEEKLSQTKERHTHTNTGSTQNTK